MRAFVHPFSGSCFVLRPGVPSREASLAVGNSKGGSQKTESRNVGFGFDRTRIELPESESEVAQSCPTLSDPMDCGPPGSSIHGIFQARVLEWGAIAFSGVPQILKLPFRCIYPIY